MCFNQKLRHLAAWDQCNPVLHINEIHFIRMTRINDWKHYRIRFCPCNGNFHIVMFEKSVHMNK